IFVERFAEHEVGFEKFHPVGAAKFVEPERRQIAEVPETALRGKRKDFEAVFEEVGFGGDFERASVILRAADDDERGVDFAAAANDAEMLEFVAKDFPDACPPIREDANAGLEAKIDGVDDGAVRAGASNAEKIFLLLGLRERSSQAESDFLDRSVNEFFGGLRNVPRQIEFLGENVGGTARKKRERNAVAILMSREAVDDFVERAISAAGDEE